MNNKQNFWSKIWSSLKNMFVQLFGFGKSKDRATANLEEEEILSPTRQIFRNFIRNKVALIGLTIFTAIILFVFVGNRVMDFDAKYIESSQIYIEPGSDHLKVPSGLKKSGIKVVKDYYGNDQYLMGIGVAHTIAISNDNKIYVWGANVNNLKKVPKEIKDNVDKIVQIAVGSNHAVVLTSDGKLLGWGSNGHQQAQIPVYEHSIDYYYGIHKKVIEAYFKPEARALYEEDVLTTIENDPIVKIDAGYEYTSVLTESGYVFTWGNTKEAQISEDRYSYRLTDIVVKYDDSEEKLTWKYNGITTVYDLATTEEIISYYDLPNNIELEFNKNILSWRHNEEEEWTEIASLEELLVDFDADIKKVKNIYALEFHLVYEFEDNKLFIMGQPGSILSKITPSLRQMLFQSAEERGYSIDDFVGTERNAFVLTSEGNIIGWGEETIENRNLYTVPKEVENKKIVDLQSGKYHLVAVDEDGNVYTWGSRNDLDQLNIPKNIGKSKKVIANYFLNYSIDENGSISSWGHKGYIFGTDAAGADNFKRIIAGGVMSLSLALIAVVVSLIIGLIVGLIAGFYGKWTDNLLMRFGEIVSAFPFLPLAMTLAKIVQDLEMEETTRVYLIMVVLGLLSWPGLARLVRGQILKEREQDFVLAAKALGIKEGHIITRHILPNVINVVIVSTTLSYAGALLTESGLSFLGFGVRYPNPSWGNMLTGTQSMTVLKYYWWAWIIPAVFIILTALSVNLVGDGLREAMDPKANER